MKWLDVPLSAVIVKLTSLVVEKEAMKEYPKPCGESSRVVRGVSVEVVEVTVVAEY